MPLTPVNNVTLALDEAGDGEPLVLVHGSWDDRAVWAEVVPPLARKFRVVTYDRRGHSESVGGSPEDSRRDDEDDLEALLQERGGAHVLTSSFGGCIALGLATRRPDLFHSLCAHEPPLLDLVDPSLRAGFDPIVEMIEAGRTEEAARAFTDEVIEPDAWEHLPPEARAMLIRNAATWAGEMRDPDSLTVDTEALRRFDQPVLLTRGSDSAPFFAAVIEILAEVLPQADVQTLRGTGHVPHETHPDLYSEVVLEFLAAWRPSTRA